MESLRRPFFSRTEKKEKKKKEQETRGGKKGKKGRNLAASGEEKGSGEKLFFILGYKKISRREKKSPGSAKDLSATSLQAK